MRKKGLTIDEHRAAGLEMKEIHQALLNLKVIYCAAYPRKITPALPLGDAIKALTKARCMAEERLYDDFPKEADTQVYYGTMTEEKRISINEKEKSDGSENNDD
jgi:hypothetical protein